MRIANVIVFKRLMALLAAGALVVAAMADDRTWTDLSGRTLSARLLSVENGAAKLRLANGRISSVDIQKLSKTDRDYLRTWRTRRLDWPDEINVKDDVTVTTVRENANDRSFVYQTRHFEFHSDRKIAASLIKDFALAFEATFAALEALPLQLEPKPPEGHFQIRLFGDRFDYYAAGGILGSAGVYVPMERHILVPMELLGLKRVGSELRKNRGDYDNSTLIHEITHQVMHDWLKHIPIWMVEGMAEYMSSLPYANGKFRFSESARKNGIKAGLVRWSGGQRQSSYPILPASKLFKINSRDWHDRKDGVNDYASSMLYVYYFMHLEGQGKAKRICTFSDEIKHAKKSVAEFLQKYNDALKTFMAEMKRAEDAGTKSAIQEADVPEILQTAPDEFIFRKEGAHAQALKRLLGDRSLDELTQDVIDAFSKEGIRLQ